MRVTTRPMEPAVALVEYQGADPGERRRPHRVLVFRPGLLSEHIVRTLDRLLRHVD